MDLLSFIPFGEGDNNDNFVDSVHELFIFLLSCFEPLAQFDLAHASNCFDPFVGKFIVKIVAFLVFPVADSFYDVLLGRVSFDFSQCLVLPSSFKDRLPRLFPGGLHRLATPMVFQKGCLVSEGSRQVVLYR